MFKVWSLSKASNGTIPCLRTVKTALQKPTAIAIAENGIYLAIGFDRGTVSLYRGDISRDRSKVQKTISCGTMAILGIAFKQYAKAIQMFVCTESHVLVFDLQHKDKEIKTTLDSNETPVRCCALQSTQITSDAHFMVGRDDVSHLSNRLFSF